LCLQFHFSTQNYILDEIDLYLKKEMKDFVLGRLLWAVKKYEVEKEEGEMILGGLMCILVWEVKLIFKTAFQMAVDSVKRNAFQKLHDFINSYERSHFF
jgi:hypothetical protein